MNIFSIETDHNGELRDIRYLKSQCPPEFRKTNRWTFYASQLICRGADTSEWQELQKNNNMEEFGEQQLAIFLLGRSKRIELEDKIAICAWMLSEMLYDVPEYIALGNKN